ncbi:MAG: hypothetical protein VR72_03450 [Clostridiaceae bacterium BRH_c20a]|nr:MAG: hypothetical protein VR72_03450 [Clostridiaceae bacterium BRH_c20a]
MMKTNKYPIIISLVTLLIMVTAMPVMASDKILTPLLPYGEHEVQFSTDGTAIMPLATYDVYADKGDTQTSSGLWYAWGWTRLIDQISGEDIYHYTKVTYYMNDGIEGVESGRNWGYGKIWNETEETYKHSVVRVWYGIS